MSLEGLLRGVSRLLCCGGLGFAEAAEASLA